MTYLNSKKKEISDPKILNDLTEIEKTLTVIEKVLKNQVKANDFEFDI